MTNGPTKLRWMEPHWSADQRRIEFKWFPFCLAILRILSWFAAVGAVFTMVLSWMGDFARQQIWKVWWTLALVSLAMIVLSLLRGILDRWLLPMTVTLRDGEIRLDNALIGELNKGDDVTIEIDEHGYRWLVIYRRCAKVELSRIGVADDIKTAALEEAIRVFKQRHNGD